jgi:hypothetical protein
MKKFSQSDIEELSKFAEDLSYHKVKTDFGEDGIVELKQLNRTIRELYKYISVELIQELVVVNCVENDKRKNFSKRNTTPKELHNLSTLARDEFEFATIQIVRDDLVLFYEEEILDIEEVRQVGVIYQYKNGREKIFCKSDENTLISFSGFPSIYAMPTFKELESAFEYYYNRRAKGSNCRYLEDSWFDGNKIFPQKRPEHYHRKSLYDFLDITLRDADVNEEQNIDDTQPIDIKVAWNFANHLALIEIKWLGKSLNELGDDFTAKHYAGRAREGYDQLISYMDLNKKRTFQKKSIGYLVVFDARRRNTNPQTRKISEEDGFHYRNDEIEYEPAPCTRQDIATPVHFFMEPNCTA